jgi:hypothetical protein
VFRRRVVRALLYAVPLGDTMKTISWNRKAVEQAKAQGFDDPRHTICTGCGTNPKLRQFRALSV